MNVDAVLSVREVVAMYENCTCTVVRTANIVVPTKSANEVDPCTTVQY